MKVHGYHGPDPLCHKARIKTLVVDLKSDPKDITCMLCLNKTSEDF